jgi:hypothetical protein
MSIRTKPFPDSFIINTEEASNAKYFSKKFDYEDLLLAAGQHVKDFQDLSQVAQRFYSAYSTTLSETITPFYEYVAGSGGIRDVDENHVRWKIYSKPDRRAISMGNPNSDAEYYGASGYSFRIRLDVDWFGPNDVLAPLRQKRVAVVVQSEAVERDGAFEYDVIMLDKPESARVFPKALLKEGDYYIKMGSLASDLGSNTWGTLQMGWDFSYIEFEVPMTTMQWKFSIDEDAHEKWGNLELARCDMDGRPIPESAKITNFLEVQAMAQVKLETELYLTYGEMTDHLADRTTGKRITSSPGLFQYLEQGNEIYYDPTVDGIDLIVSEIDSLWFDRVAPSQRKLLLYTGQGGLKLFHDWIQAKYAETATVTPIDFILGPASAHSEGREGHAFGKAQFTKYYLPVFGEITVAYWALLDNTRISTVTYPGTHYPVSSFEFIALDYGFGQTNVEILRRSGKDFSTYIPGLWSPFGKTTQDNPVFKTPADTTFWGYHWVHRKSFGLVAYDTSRLLRFLPNVI